jgi:hypothetical protein
MRWPSPLTLGVIGLMLMLIGLGWRACDAHAAPTWPEQQIIDKAASQSFPGSPCEGRTTVVRSTMDELKVMTGWSPGTPEPGGAALQDNSDGTCRVFILANQVDSDDQYQFCLTYVHEYGHLSGANHGEPLMGDLGPSYGPCLAIRPRITGYHASVLIRARINVRGWHLECLSSSVGAPDTAYCIVAKRMRKRAVRWRSYSVTTARYGGPVKITFLGSALDKA